MKGKSLPVSESLLLLYRTYMLPDDKTVTVIIYNVFDYFLLMLKFNDDKPCCQVQNSQNVYCYPCQEIREGKIEVFHIVFVNTIEQQAFGQIPLQNIYKCCNRYKFICVCASVIERACVTYKVSKTVAAVFFQNQQKCACSNLCTIKISLERKQTNMLYCIYLAVVVTWGTPMKAKSMTPVTKFRKKSVLKNVK